MTLHNGLHLILYSTGGKMNIKIRICIAVVVLIATSMISCNAQKNEKNVPLITSSEVSPTERTETEAILTATISPIEEKTDVMIYSNYFEDEKNAGLFEGITTSSGSLNLNKSNLDVQSGKQALEITGTIQGPLFSSLEVTFEIGSLFGFQTLDLSTKTIRFSYFVPEDSPIDIIVLVILSDTGQVSLENFNTNQEGDVNSKNSWHDAEVNVSNIYKNADWAWSDLSDEESQKTIKNAEKIMIAAMRQNEGQSVKTSFLIDNLKWINNDVQQIVDQNENSETLRTYADRQGIMVSSTLLYDPSLFVDTFSDPWYRYTLATQFNMTSAGVPNPPAEKPDDISQIEFDYTLTNETLEFIDKNNLYLYGGTGGWHTGNPRWITDGTYEELKTFLDKKIESNLTHYKGKVLYWGVFNEILDSNGISLHNRQKKDINDVMYGTDWAPYGGRFSPYVDGDDTSLIEFAFAKARSVDPDAKLFLNEFGVEEFGTDRSNFFHNLVLDMKNRGVPIDGIGIQLHLMYPKSPAPGGTDNLSNVEKYLDRIDENVKQYAIDGFFVAFTEFECQIRLDDIDLSTQEGQDEYSRRQLKQAEIYAGIMKIVKENPNVAFINFWSVADRPQMSAYDWSGMEGQVENVHKFVYTDSFLFDKNYEPKPAYFAMMEELTE